MRVFNITDASTAALRERGLENQPLRIGDTVILPGTYADLRGTAKETSELQVFVKVRAVALDELPVDYAAKRGLDIYGRKLTPEPVKEKVTFMAPASEVPEKFELPDLKLNEILPMEEAPKKRGR